MTDRVLLIHIIISIFKNVHVRRHILCKSNMYIQNKLI